MKLVKSCFIVLFGIFATLTLTGRGYCADQLILWDGANFFKDSSDKVPTPNCMLEPPTPFDIFCELQVDSISRLFPNYNPAETLYTRPDGHVAKLVNLSRYWTVYPKYPLTASQFNNLYQTVDPNHSIAPNTAGTPDYIPNDLDPTRQFYLLQSQIAPAWIGATKAWDFTTGSPTSTMAIVDGGFNKDHFEYASRVAGVLNYSIGPGAGHGTAVAGIALARGDNDTGIAGIDWNTKALLIKAVIIGDLAKACDTASKHGCKVICITQSPNDSVSGVLDPIGRNALADATYNAWVRDVSVCASMGNENSSTFQIPCGFPTAIGVGAVDNDGKRLEVTQYSGSSFGDHIDISAPGEDLWRTTHDGGDSGSVAGGFSGTSAAVPLVAGSLSLIRAANPALLADEAEQILFQTARDVQQSGVGWDMQTGWGVVNVGDAVERAHTLNKIDRKSVVPTLSIGEGGGILLTFVDNHGGLASGRFPAQTDTGWGRHRWYHEETYPYNHTPKVFIRTRSTFGWYPGPLDFNDTVVMFPSAIAIVDSVNKKIRVETASYTVAHGTGGGWVPCDTGIVCQDPSARIAYSIAYCSNPGDASNDCGVNMGDVTFLVSYIFQNGQTPPILADADADGDCSITMGDVVYLISFIFNGGTPPVYGNCGSGSLKVGAGDNIAATDDVSLSVGADSAGYLPLNISTLRAINGISITLNALNGSQVDVISRSAVPLHWSQSGDVVRIGLVDIYGQKLINPSDSALIAIRGDFEINAVEVAQIDSAKAVQLFKPKFVNGRNTTVNPNAIKQIAFDGISPNPANPTAEVYFSLPAKASVTIEVFNILGQRVATVANREFDPGSHRVRWEGRDDANAPVASGVYFVRMTSGEFTAKKKLLMLK